jgi:hypothetical protein
MNKHNIELLGCCAPAPRLVKITSLCVFCGQKRYHVLGFLLSFCAVPVIKLAGDGQLSGGQGQQILF